MINNKKVVVIMPAYNAEKTLKQTYDEIYHDFVDEVILVDDNSQDNTKDLSKELKITTIVHKENKGYGANQKSCYKAALKAGADIVVMLHPDYQYTPKLIPAMVSMMAFGEHDAVIAS
ncbi:MAG TPA: glycosyltransferase family 2 protein, partial [Candidatus Gastranaerophilaceae bacterium]|nr:glycosyltransferase family 2 protein [Candidatus Gastranaerophilaceae bacterium]